MKLKRLRDFGVSDPRHLVAEGAERWINAKVRLALADSKVWCAQTKLLVSLSTVPPHVASIPSVCIVIATVTFVPEASGGGLVRAVEAGGRIVVEAGLASPELLLATSASSLGSELSEVVGRVPIDGVDCTVVAFMDEKVARLEAVCGSRTVTLMSGVSTIVEDVLPTRRVRLVDGHLVFGIPSGIGRRGTTLKVCSPARRVGDEVRVALARLV